MFDVIFVPEGMEARAVAAALRRAKSPMRTEVIGLGPERARESIARALRSSPVRSALIAGVCGLLARNLRPGDALVYATLRNAAQTDPLVRTDADLTRMLTARLPHTQPQTQALQWNSVVTTAREKNRLGRLYDAQAVDMESYAGVAFLQNAGVRAAVLRIASDGANDDLPDLNAAIGRDGALNGFALAREMLVSPRAGIRMAWNGMAAIRNLQHAVTRVAHA